MTALDSAVQHLDTARFHLVDALGGQADRRVAGALAYVYRALSALAEVQAASASDSEEARR